MSCFCRHEKMDRCRLDFRIEQIGDRYVGKIGQWMQRKSDIKHFFVEQKNVSGKRRSSFRLNRRQQPQMLLLCKQGRSRAIVRTCVRYQHFRRLEPGGPRPNGLCVSGLCYPKLGLLVFGLVTESESESSSPNVCTTLHRISSMGCEKQQLDSVSGEPSQCRITLLTPSTSSSLREMLSGYGFQRR